MRHAAVMVDVEGTHRVIPLDDDVCNEFIFTVIIFNIFNIYLQSLFILLLE